MALNLSTEDLDAIRAIVREENRNTKDDGTVGGEIDPITWQKGALCRTKASDENLPGVVFSDPRLLDPKYGLGLADRAFVMLNCGVDENGERNASFGGGWAQSDSVSRNPLQDQFTPRVFHVMYSGVLGRYMLDFSKPVGASVDKFPDVFACRPGANIADWSRLTAEDWKSRGWIPGQSGYKG